MPDDDDRLAPTIELIRRFYVAFSVRDWRVMSDCYAPDATFEDPVFRLRGERIGLMWRMLCTNAREFSLEFSDVAADATSGRAHWQARYCFSQTGRMVHNDIDAAFTFRDGRIASHVDSFDFWRWSRQALGAPGWALGWSDTLRDKVRRRAARGLDHFAMQLGVGREP
jgi:ketosteroid isomerase-like protein